MKTLGLLSFCFISVLLQGCIGVVYIPPATAQTPKTELVHVSRLNTLGKDLYILKINGTTVMEPAPGLGWGTVRAFDFYLLPGTYSVDYRVLALATTGQFSMDTQLVNTAGKIEGFKIVTTATPTTGTVTTGTTSVVVSPTQAGKTLVDFDFLAPSGVLSR